MTEKKQKTWLQIPFTKRVYEVSKQGKIASWNPQETDYKILRGRKISKTNPRLSIDVIVKKLKKRKGVLVSRLTFFCYYYAPKVLKKELKKCTWNDFINMPQIVHKNGIVTDDRLVNLIMKLSHREVSIWALKAFPHKYVLLKRTSSIKGTDATLCKKLLLEGVSYPEIAKKLSVQLHWMAVQRFNLNNKIDIGRKNCDRALTVKQVKKIPLLQKTMTQKEIAVHYGVTETVISRIITGKYYKKEYQEGILLLSKS
jgi:hypothetical protein